LYFRDHSVIKKRRIYIRFDFFVKNHILFIWAVSCRSKKSRAKNRGIEKNDKQALAVKNLEYVRRPKKDF